MSRILRRPMFRGGRVDSRGTGIASGLGYEKGGSVNTPKRGLVNEPGGYAGEYRFGETGFGKTLGALNPRPAFYELFNTLANKGSQFFTGYNPGLSYNKMLRAERDLKDKMMGKDPLKRTDRMTDDEVDYTDFFFMKPSAKKGWTTPSMQPEEKEEDDTELSRAEIIAKIKAEEEAKRQALIESLTPKELTEDEKLAKIEKNKAMIHKAYGSGRADDASAMLLNFAGKALKPEATVKSAFGEFFEEEGKRPSESKKYKDAATTAAINAFLTGEKTLAETESFMKRTDYTNTEKLALAERAQRGYSMNDFVLNRQRGETKSEALEGGARKKVDFGQYKEFKKIKSKQNDERVLIPESVGIIFLDEGTREVFTVIIGEDGKPAKQILYGV